MENEYAFEMATSSIRYGPGVTREVGMDLSQLKVQRVMVVTDPNLAELPPVATVRESLEKALEVGNHLSGKDDEDPFFRDKTVFSGKSPPDLSANHDAYLYESNEVEKPHGTQP